MKKGKQVADQQPGIQQQAQASSSSSFLTPVNASQVDNGHDISSSSLDQHGQEDQVETLIDPTLAALENVISNAQQQQQRLPQQSSISGPSRVRRTSPVLRGIGVGVKRETNQAQNGINNAAEGSLAVEDEIDPAWSEIVKSLTNAQQSSDHGIQNATGGESSQNHLADQDESERLQQSLQNTLEHLAQEGLHSLFPGQFPQSPTSQFLLPHEQSAVEDPSAVPIVDNTGENAASPSTSTPNEAGDTPLKRGRGRPKGSKNKPNPDRVKIRKPRVITKPRPKKPTPPPKRPRGRPPKVREPEAQALHDLRKHERELGIKRSKGRPRKFPGYLVREMRLKKNREEYTQLMRNYEDDRVLQLGEQDNNAMDIEKAVEEASSHAAQNQDLNLDLGDDGQDDALFQHWDTGNPDQSLLDAVGAAARQVEDYEGEDSSGMPEGLRQALTLGDGERMAEHGIPTE